MCHRYMARVKGNYLGPDEAVCASRLQTRVVPLNMNIPKVIIITFSLVKKTLILGGMPMLVE